LLGKGIITYELAVEYVRDKAKYREQAAKIAAGTGNNERNSYNKSRNYSTAKQKPKIDIIADAPKTAPLSDEKREEMRRKARKLDGKLD
jgi:replication initiation and membrane attachment protein